MFFMRWVYESGFINKVIPPIQTIPIHEFVFFLLFVYFIFIFNKAKNVYKNRAIHNTLILSDTDRLTAGCICIIKYFIRNQRIDNIFVRLFYVFFRENRRIKPNISLHLFYIFGNTTPIQWTK